MIIHQIWVGGELQPILKYYTKTFKKLPGFQYKLWGMKDLTEKNFPLTWWYIKDFLTRPKIVWAKIADLMRLELLYHNGGIYVDTTMEYIGNIDIITNSTAKFIMSNEEPCGLACRGTDNRLFISNSFIASVPKYKVLERLLSEKYLSKIDLDGKANLTTGPYYVRTGIKRHNDVKMLSRDLIYPFVEEDTCVKYEPGRGLIKTKYFNTEFYIKFPCKQHPDSIMIKHWDVGGSWR
jgi:hypothetical protein